MIQKQKTVREKIFVKAYMDYEKSLLKHSLFKVSDQDLADDMVQTTFMKTWEYMARNGKIDSMKGFLFHVLNNMIIDEYRKHKAVSLETMTDGGFQVAIDDSDRVFNIIDGKTATLLIPLLSDRYREVVSMRYLESMSLEEIAATVGRSRNTIAVQVCRGVVKLSTLFHVDNKMTTLGQKE